MKFYPNDYVPPAETPPLVITSAQKNWVKTQLQAHMTENRAYTARELIDYVQAQIASQYPNKHFSDRVVLDVIEEVDAEWGWHPPEPVEE